MRTDRTLTSFLIGILLLPMAGGCRCSERPRQGSARYETALILESVFRKDTLLTSLATAGLSNSGKGEVVISETVRLRARAAALEEEVKELLTGDQLKAFCEERTTYHQWDSLQQEIAGKVIPILWDIYAGGSAGGSFQTVYLYDIENLNHDDMENLIFHLKKPSGKATQMVYPSFEPFMDATDRFLTATLRRASEGPDHQTFLHTVTHDMTLFPDWIESRERLTRLLPWPTAAVYARMTQLIIDGHTAQYGKCFIGDDSITK
jgi:hypothetical protein